MSATVYPGSGQLLQKRWLIGSIFVLIATAILVWFVWELLRVLAALWSLTDFDAPAKASPGYMPLVRASTAGLLCYLASLADTILAHLHATRRIATPPAPPR